MKNHTQPSPMEQVQAFGVVFLAGMLVSAMVALAAKWADDTR